MAALDFPASPSNGQQFTGPGGVIWVYDSTKTAWVSGTLTTGIYAPITNDNGRNLIHNSMFNVAQRGAGPWSVSGYTLDRWVLSTALDAASVQQLAHNNGTRAAIGDEAATVFLASTVTGNAGATAFTYFAQFIEGVRRLGGKTVTLSFWAVCSVPGNKLGINALQYAGTGGSPAGSAWVYPTGAPTVTLTGAWTRYSVTIAIPSTASMTLGTNNNDYTSIAFWQSSGANNNAVAGGIGVQTGTVQIWGVQLELGPTATPLEKLDPVTQLQQCQRFYQVLTALSMLTVSGGAGNTFGTPITFPTMRGTPLITPVSPTYSNASGLTTANATPSGATVYASLVGVAAGQWTTNLTLSADL